MRQHIQLAYTDYVQPELSGRPIRDSIIEQDDIINLKIALETGSDISELLVDKHLFS